MSRVSIVSHHSHQLRRNMLSKSSFTPHFSAIPHAQSPPTKPPGRALTAALARHCPPTVRQNASTNPTSFLQLHNLPPTSAYIHLPFCRKRCHYCDFPIIALGSSSSIPDDPRILNYVETVCREIKATKVNSSDGPPLETVFFGGGTPSLVAPHHVSWILETLSTAFGVCSHAEISMEMDPGTFDARTMRELMDLGVNRVSLGVQAFQEDLLTACGRAHGVREIHEALDIINSCGVENWSLDLISSLPHQSPSMWQESLQLSIQAQPTHVSVYDLQIEQNTKFGALYTPGEFPLPSENQSAEFYRMASTMLTDAAFDHYEISSYCKSGYRCKHNSTYWKNKPFYAFGLGSASYISGIRFSRPRKLKEYAAYVQSLEDGQANHAENNVIDAKELAMDVVMLSLRTSDGLNLEAFGEAFGEELLVSICEAYGPYVERGLMVCLDKQREVIAAEDFMLSLSNGLWGNRRVAFLRLSDPDGFLLSNELISVAFRAIAP